MFKFDLGGRSYNIPNLSETGGRRGAEMRVTVPSQVKEGDPRFEELQKEMLKRHQDFQAGVSLAVADFDPFKDSIKKFDFTKADKVIRHSTVDEMAARFGYDEGQKAIIDSLLFEKVSQPSKDLWKKEVTLAQRQQARAFHVGYASGQIERAFSFMNGLEKDPITLKMNRAKIQYAVGVTLELIDQGKAASFELKKKYLKEKLEELFPKEQKDIESAMHLVEKSTWLLDDFNEENEVLVKKNTMGLFATRALVDFARQMYPQRDEGEVLRALDALVNNSDEVLQDIAALKNPKRKDALIDAQIIHFAVRAANYAWAFAVIPQGFAEQQKEIAKQQEENAKMSRELSEAQKRANLAVWQESKPKIGAGRYTYNKDKNASFTTFDNMSETKGWPEVLLDMDQIRTGIRILRSEYNAKLSESSHPDKTQ